MPIGQILILLGLVMLGVVIVLFTSPLWMRVGKWIGKIFTHQVQEAADVLDEELNNKTEVN